MKHIIGFFFIALICASCGGGTSDNGCKMGTPRAMFSETLQGVTNHSFRLVQNNSTEEFTYNGNPVTIYQTGCDQVTQEFQFSYSNKTNEDKEAMEKVAAILSTWSKLGKNHIQFASWAEQIRIVGGEMRLGETFSPSPYIEIGIDRVNQATGEILTLSLIQKD